MVVIEVFISNITLLGRITYRYKAFTGRAPFYDSTPTSAAVRVLSGSRPERPAHPSVTDDLWNIVKHCWNREPERRPGISQVVLCLQATSLRRGSADASGNPATDDAMLSGFARRKGFWFLRHRVRQSSTHSSPAKQGECAQRSGFWFWG